MKKLIIKSKYGYQTMAKVGGSYYVTSYVMSRDEACVAAAAPLNSNAIDVEKTRRRIEDRLRKDPAAVVEVAKLLFGGCAMEF